MKNPNLDKFPLGFWSTLEAGQAPIDQPKDWAEMGMTLTMGDAYKDGVTDKAHFKAMLDCAYEQGLKIILCDERAESRTIAKIGFDGYRANLQAVVDDWGSHPAIWGVHLGDEPNMTEYPLFIRAIHLCQEIAPQWQPYANLLPWAPGVQDDLGLTDWSKYLDDFVKDSGMKFLSYDCYTQMRSDPMAWPIYFHNLKLYGDAARRNDIPFWTILLSVPHFKYRNPSLDDIRWQLNTAVASGAKGISWFYLYQQNIWYSNYRNAPVNQVGRKTQLYYDISDVQNIFNRTLAPVMDKLTLQKVYHICKAYGGFELFYGDEEVEFHDSEEPMIMSYFTDEADPEWKYLLLVNNSCTESVLYTVTLHGHPSETQELICDGEWRSMSGKLHDDGDVKLTETGMQLPHWYAPGQAVLYRYKR